MIIMIVLYYKLSCDINQQFLGSTLWRKK